MVKVPTIFYSEATMIYHLCPCSCVTFNAVDTIYLLTASIPEELSQRAPSSLPLQHACLSFCIFFFSLTATYPAI